MTSTRADRRRTHPSPAERPARVRRTAGGTAAGRSTLTRLPAERHDVTVLDGHRVALRDRPPGFLAELLGLPTAAA
ncbi:hypothetical protein ACFVVL_28330 [Kitasatospora sp. NPDC058115]|uniref:hypothetical protein n=1 Tax=Kitasatospora sp. NPDC058115 TaxID=3346347 RepID=UPI0036DCA8FF